MMRLHRMSIFEGSKNEYNRSNSNYSGINLYRICILHT